MRNAAAAFNCMSLISAGTISLPGYVSHKSYSMFSVVTLHLNIPLFIMSCTKLSNSVMLSCLLGMATGDANENANSWSSFHGTTCLSCLKNSNLSDLQLLKENISFLVKWLVISISFVSIPLSFFVSLSTFTIVTSGIWIK